MAKHEVLLLLNLGRLEQIEFDNKLYLIKTKGTDLSKQPIKKRQKGRSINMIEGLIAAAGKSQRTGHHYKMALDFGGRSMIEKCLDSMSPFCSKIIVVAGYNAERLKTLLKGYKDVEIIVNSRYEDGMFSSIKTGLKQIRADRFFFQPGDCPLISPSVYQKMLEVDSEIVVPTFNNRPGHPVLFKHTVIEKILISDLYPNLREFIRANNPNYIAVDCPGIRMDIDTLADYQKALEKIRGTQ